jgi:DNA-binding CsgD family transcriptional regulator
MVEVLIIGSCLIAVLLLRALGALAISLASAEAEILAPKAALVIVRIATRLLPKEYRIDYAETWAAELSQLEERPLKAIWFALFQCLLSVPGLRRELPVDAQNPDEAIPSIPPPAPTAGTLTRRQIQVLRLLSDGGSTAHIAKSLGLSEATVKTHLKNAMARLNARNRTHLIALALRSGLLDA